jgi:hypothetical protein
VRLLALHPLHAPWCSVESNVCSDLVLCTFMSNCIHSMQSGFPPLMVINSFIFYASMLSVTFSCNCRQRSWVVLLPSQNCSWRKKWELPLSKLVCTGCVFCSTLLLIQVWVCMRKGVRRCFIAWIIRQSNARIVTAMLICLSGVQLCFTVQICLTMHICLTVWCAFVSPCRCV